MLYLGIDIGGTKCAVVAGDENYNILERTVFETGKDKEPSVIIDKIIEICKCYRNK